jgi:hypothetical protein
MHEDRSEANMLETRRKTNKRQSEPKRQNKNTHLMEQPLQPIAGKIDVEPFQFPSYRRDEQGQVCRMK